MRWVDSPCVHEPTSMNSAPPLCYLGKKGNAVDETFDGKKAQPATNKRRQNKKKMSIIVLRQSYSHLAPIIHSIFEGAEDIRVVLDRRQHDRRQQSIAMAVERRRETRDRRKSSPILDIVIDIDD